MEEHYVDGCTDRVFSRPECVDDEIEKLQQCNSEDITEENIETVNNLIDIAKKEERSDRAEALTKLCHAMYVIKSFL